ncbi:MAG: 6-carboxytetrahydropterin synthase [Bacteroidota bacterium]
MYTVKIREHIMIAHSLPDPVFGPAQNLHGATYVVDAEFQRPELDEHQIVIDIGLASELLRKVLAPLAYQNLDDLPQFTGALTTTEYLARYIHDQLVGALDGSFPGSLKVILGESHVAWASYQGPSMLA